jgi:hypothetical protein
MIVRQPGCGVAAVRNGWPAPLELIWLNKRCSMGFHCEQPVGF